MRSERPSRPATAPGNIVIDGDPSEWPDGEAFLADADYLYFRVRSQAGPEGPQPIQASPESLVLLLDTDGRDRTGATVQDPPDASGLGVDLEIHFSPAAGVSEHRNGVAIYTNTSEGRTPVTNGEIGLLASPTFAATEHEGRIARFMPGLGLPEAGLRSSGRVRGMFILRDREGEIAGWSDPFDVDVPQARGARALSTATIPERPGNALRVMSYNVLFASPVRNSGPFAGVINAIDPDVILFQEWTAEDAGSVRGWLGAMVPGEPAWNVMTGAGWGVALASRFPMRPFGPTNLPGPSRNDDGSQRAVNFLGAIIESPVGPVAVVTVHLKCCGGSTGPEEDTRRAEARRINDALVLALEQNPDVVGLVVGGDMNLVGSRLPIDIIGSGLDADGSSLEAAYTRVLGDDAVYTWYESDNRFPPGRLDWLLYGEAYSEAINAFALDTQRLADGPLAQSGLYRDDSRASDHLPLVVDVRPRGN
ncbi:MAG: endonuclease/exonuclease/phosphatase family protein [Planctomycetota bacterium]